MRVEVFDLHNDRPAHDFVGTEDDIKAELLREFETFVLELDPECGLEEMVDHLNSRIPGLEFTIPDTGANAGAPEAPLHKSEGDEKKEYPDDQYLSLRAQKDGYHLATDFEPKQGRLRSVVLHGHKPVGQFEASLHDDQQRGQGRALHLRDADLHEDHAHLGLGTCGFEALFAAARKHGVDMVYGSPASENASKVHRLLAAKYGLGYRNDPTKAHKTISEWEEVSRPMEKKEDPLGEYLGFRPEKNPYFRAASFISGKHTLTIDPEVWRQALYEADNDRLVAALLTFSLPVDEVTKRAVREVAKTMSIVGHAEPTALNPLRKSEEAKTPVLPLVSTANETAEEINDTIEHGGDVRQVQLGGRHSKGTIMVAGVEKSWLLKPGSGALSPAAGMAEVQGSQARRETCFWAVADHWGLKDDLPRADLVSWAGKEYAALHLLDSKKGWKNLGDVDDKDHNRVLRALQPYRTDGDLHRWAVLDNVLGNSDRHAHNLMISANNRIALIDHGSCFAGKDYAPATDKKSFVPFYLRAWVPPGSWEHYTPEQKRVFLPTLSPEVDEKVRKWVFSLDENELALLINSYGISGYEPIITRLMQLKDDLSRSATAAEIINGRWIPASSAPAPSGP